MILMFMKIKKNNIIFLIYLKLTKIFRNKRINKISFYTQIFSIKQKNFLKKIFFNNLQLKKNKNSQHLNRQFFILNLLLLENIKKNIFLCKLNEWKFYFKFVKKNAFFFLPLNFLFLIYKYFLIVNISYFWIYMKPIFTFINFNLSKLVNYVFIKNAIFHLKYISKRKFFKFIRFNHLSINGLNFLHITKKYHKLNKFFNIIYIKTINLRVVHIKSSNNLRYILNSVIKNKKNVCKYLNHRIEQN
jgi:hypothetical protein